MKAIDSMQKIDLPETEEAVEGLVYDFGLSRRSFVHVLGAGLAIAVSPGVALAQRREGRRGRGARSVLARVHIAEDGTITVLTGKVEMGQGARAELSQAAAEELRVPVGRIHLIMGDTGLVPDDGITAGSRTTPSTVPAVRKGAAAARDLLVELACARWKVGRDAVKVRDGQIQDPTSHRSLTYADLTKSGEVAKAFRRAIPYGVALTPVKEWKVMGTSVPRPHSRDFVTGAHAYPTDWTRPGMLYGKVLRPPAYGAQLTDIDLDPAKAMKDVLVVRDGQFVGVAAPSTFLANQALQAVAATAKWEPRSSYPSSQELFTYLDQHAEPRNNPSPFAGELERAAKVIRETYHVAYIQHAPLEPRVALAEWEGGRLTVWTGTQNPFGYYHELSRAFHLSGDRVRVVVPDFGGGFGGKHTGEAAVEAARLARGVGRPVLLRWTREEEFMWAYFRPAGVIQIQASLDGRGTLTSWHQVNVNSGGSAVETPYRIGRAQGRFVRSDPPLRQGSYRALAATANNFAREACMDELAAAAGMDPLAFRLAHLENPRIRAVLEEATRHFGWRERVKEKRPDIGVGLACGTEKGSCVAACAEIELDPKAKAIHVRHVCEAFECGAVVNPDNLVAQIEGCIVMGLGGALREAIEFSEGRVTNGNFGEYLVPRFEDVPTLDIRVLDRRDLPSVGAGETPIMAIAPAIANGVFHATGKRCRAMPIRLADAV